MLQNRWGLLAVVITIGHLQASNALASEGSPCSLEMVVGSEISWRGLYGRGYEASSPQTAEPAMLRVRHSGGACRYMVVVSDVVPLVGQGATLSFDVLDAPSGRSIASSDPSGGPGQRVERLAADGESDETISVYVTIPPSQQVRGGSYSGSALVSLYHADGHPELVSQTPLAISVRVPPSLSVRSDLFSSSRSAFVDLGLLEDGTTTTVDFSVTANVSVSVRVESQTGGMLRHQSGLAGISYSLRLAGTVLDLGGGQASSRLDITPGLSRDVPMLIETQPYQSAPAGRYSDTITVTFSSEG